MITKVILTCLSNSFFDFSIKMKNEKRTVFRFPFFLWKWKTNEGIKNSKKESIKHKNGGQLFQFEVKAKSKYRILNFVFQFIKKMKWNFGYTDCRAFANNRFLLNNYVFVICLQKQNISYIFLSSCNSFFIEKMKSIRMINTSTILIRFIQIAKIS